MEWNNIKEMQPEKEYGNAFEFWIGNQVEEGERNGFSVVGIWDGCDWLLPHFESISGYQGMSGTKYFETYKPEHWREYRSLNLAHEHL